MATRAPSPRSFCMVTTFFPPYHFGGDATFIYRLSNALARRGHEVTVVHSVDAYRVLRRGEPTAQFPLEPGVTVHRVERGPLAPLTTYVTGRPMLNRKPLREVFEGKQFDVVHFHNVSLMGGPGALGYGDGVKLYTMHEHWLVCPMHVLFRNNREPCVEPHCFRCELAYHRPPQLWRHSSLLDRSLDEIDLFLSPSAFTAEAHRERGFRREIRELPYFLPPPETPSPQNPRPPRDRPYFLFVGRLVELKGVESLLRHFRQYRDADLVIVGDGPLDRRLRKEAADLEHVHFIGRLHPAEIATLYANAIALIVPSIGFEVFGIVTLEAFAYGTPAIVRDLGALPEPVRTSGGGYVYGTDDELTEATERLRLDRAHRDELGRKGRAAWEIHWSEDAHLERYFAAIEDARHA